MQFQYSPYAYMPPPPPQILVPPNIHMQQLQQQHDAVTARLVHMEQKLDLLVSRTTKTASQSLYAAATRVSCVLLQGVMICNKLL